MAENVLLCPDTHSGDKKHFSVIFQTTLQDFAISFRSATKFYDVKTIEYTTDVYSLWVPNL